MLPQAGRRDGEFALAGLASMLPAASWARTWKVCGPAASGPSVVGELQAANVPPSTLHSKLEPGSLAENSNVGVESAVTPAGPASIVVCGAFVSTFTVVVVASLESELPSLAL